MEPPKTSTLPFGWGTLHFTLANPGNQASGREAVLNKNQNTATNSSDAGSNLRYRSRYCFELLKKGEHGVSLSDEMSGLGLAGTLPERGDKRRANFPRLALLSF